MALAVALVGCGSASGSGDGGPPDASEERDAGATRMDAGRDAGSTPTALRPCAVGFDACFFLTPEETGLPATGAGATVDQIALRPSAPRGELLVFLNGSGGSPRGPVASDPRNNFYTVARDAGLHVLAVSYRSDDPVGRLCPPTSPTRDACYEPTRRAIVTGVPQEGAAPELAGIEEHEGVYARIAAALRTLAAGDPDGGWNAFIDDAATEPGAAIRWDRVFVSGHSQGGGHAALLGKLHGVARVVMLAAPCDSVSSAPASWLTRTAEYRTEAARYVALGALGDPICGTQYAAWDRLGLSDAASDDSAVVCAGEDAHSAPIRCNENAERWSALLR